jgi:hypothetical protein
METKVIGVYCVNPLNQKLEIFRLIYDVTIFVERKTGGGGAKIFQIYKSDFKITSPTNVAWSTFHTKDPKLLGNPV